MSGPRPLLTRLSVAAEPAAWREAGFRLDGDAATVGPVTISLAGAGAGKRITGWELSGLSSTELDGLPTSRSCDAPPEAAGVAAHPNGVTQLDHVVAFSPDLDRTVAAIEAAGLDLRRVREGPTAAGAQRQAFFRVGDPCWRSSSTRPAPRRPRTWTRPRGSGAWPSSCETWTRARRGSGRCWASRETRSSRGAGSRPCAVRRGWACPWP